MLGRIDPGGSLTSDYIAGHAPRLQHRTSSRGPDGASYFGFPAIKKPEWKWFVPAYFFIGGIASGAYIVATLADLTRRAEYRSYALAGRVVSLTCLLLCPVLLIADLGRPERFLNMLRVIKPRSMMSLGSW